LLKLARGGSYLGTVGVSPPAWTRKAGERGALEPPCLKAQSPTRYAPRRRGARGRRSVSDCEFATRAESLKRKGPEHRKKRRRSRAWTVRFSFAQDRTVLHAHSSQYSPAWHRSFVQTTDSRLPTYPEATGHGPLPSLPPAPGPTAAARASAHALLAATTPKSIPLHVYTTRFVSGIRRRAEPLPAPRTAAHTTAPQPQFPAAAQLGNSPLLPPPAPRSGPCSRRSRSAGRPGHGVPRRFGIARGS